MLPESTGWEREMIPERLKPNCLQGSYVRPEGHTLPKNALWPASTAEWLSTFLQEWILLKVGIGRRIKHASV
jgi:hypothetical protein